MQLTGKPTIRKALTAVTTILITGGVSRGSNDTKLDSSLLIYSEINRVHATEAVIGVKHSISDDRFLTGRLTFDVLTGPSPNGAAPSNKIQTFTRPSAGGSYTVDPGKIPKDNAFQDFRLGAVGSYIRPLDRLTTINMGGHLSSERDYLSLGTNLGISRDFNKRNTTLSASGAYSHDLVSPIGGAPTPLSEMSTAANNGGEGGEFEGENAGPAESKNVLDAVLGFTQVLDRRTLVQFDYSINYTSGYLNDPYKLISVVQDRTETEPGEPVNYLYESRPHSRIEHALYGEIRRYIGGHTIDFSYRYFRDSWGVVSNTFDLHYRFPLPGGRALIPQFRWYRQSAANFYRSYLLDSSPIPGYASADYRLAPFRAVTIGLKYLFPVAPDADLSVGGEYYYQVGDISPPASLGPLSRFDLFPKLRAIMVRVGLSHNF